MSMFCLVHGSAQGPSGWDKLVPELEALGHHCICVDLPTDQPEMGAAGYAAVISQALQQATEPAVVAAHSASGLFLPLVPQHTPVAGLVYLAAVIPQPGESFLSQFKKDPGMYNPDFVGKNPTVDEDLALQFMFHDCTSEMVRWGLATVRMMYAKQALQEPYPLPALPAVPSAYISCTRDRTINSDWWETAAKERLNTEPIRMDAGHFPHVSQAGPLAALLDQIAGSWRSNSLKK